MLYIGTDQGIYRWFAGTPWPIFHSLQGQSIIGLASPGGGAIVALDSASRVWESLNGGIDWRSVPLPEEAGRPTSLALLAEGEVLVATSKPLAIYRRPIGLISGAEAPSPLARARQLENFVIHRARSLAGRARGGAATMERPSGKLFGWTPLGIPGASTATPVSPSVRLLTADKETIYASIAGQGLWSSGDLGKTWNKVDGLPDEVFSLRFAPGLLAAGTSDGVKISTDAGATWTDHSTGLEKVRQVRALEIKPGDPKVMLAGASPVGAGEGPVADRRGLQFALYETKDGGKTWKHVTRGFPEVLESDSISDIRYLPDAPDHAAIALASGEMWNTSADGAWWEPLARQIQSARVLAVTS